jgi:antitoxin (DNA-binding transcriptional repressor) of toxin-antitoxin stability system
MGNRVIRVSDTKVVGDFGSLLDAVRLGAEVVIEHKEQPAAVVRGVEPARRTISECVALSEAHAKDLGSEPTLDPDFAADVAAVIDNRQPWKPLAWE